MTPELTVLALAGLLQALQFLLMAVPANLQLGPKTTMSPRDDGPMEAKLAPRTARLARALENHFMALILFTMAVLITVVSEQSSPFTAACAWIYLGARILYVPAYAFGWVPWRSIFYCIGWGATVAMLAASLV